MSNLGEMPPAEEGAEPSLPGPALPKVPNKGGNNLPPVPGAQQNQGK
jgi:hypothetical protein